MKPSINDETYFIPFRYQIIELKPLHVFHSSNDRLWQSSIISKLFYIYTRQPFLLFEAMHLHIMFNDYLNTPYKQLKDIGTLGDQYSKFN